MTVKCSISFGVVQCILEFSDFLLYNVKTAGLRAIRCQNLGPVGKYNVLSVYTVLFTFKCLRPL